ncbi:MAG: hypothetical protein ACRDS1_08910, partial [Pseudonocardiaceae bacterium]
MRASVSASRRVVCCQSERQCRHDERLGKLQPQIVMRVVRFLTHASVTSLTHRSPAGDVGESGSGVGGTV